MIANLRDYTISCRDDQTVCRKSLCECDLEFASAITNISNFDQVHNHTLLVRNGFDYQNSCPKRGGQTNEQITCCGDKKNFPDVDILNGQKDACCANRAFNSKRIECCSDNRLAKIGQCDLEPAPIYR